MRGSLCGYVVREHGEAPIVRALVEAVSGPALEPRATATDAAGWFVFDGLPAGQWLLHAWAPDDDTGEAAAPVYDDAFGAVTIRVGHAPGTQATVKSLVTRMQSGSIEGKVVRAGSGEPVAEAAVTVVRGPGPAPDIAPLTNAEGRFALDGLPQGEWTLQAIGPAGEAGGGTARVAPGEATRLVIEVSEFGETA